MRTRPLDGVAPRASSARSASRAPAGAARTLLVAMLLALLPATNAGAITYETGGIVYLEAPPLGGGQGGVFYANPATGDRYRIRRYLDPRGGGPDLIDPEGVAVGSDGAIYVVDGTNQDGPPIIRIDPSNGASSLVSGPSSTGPLLLDSRDIDATPSDGLVIGGLEAPQGGSFTQGIYTVDAASGTRTRISSSGAIDLGAGPPLDIQRHVDVAPNGDIYAVARTDAGDEGLFRVDPISGDRILLVSGADGFHVQDVTVSVLGDVFALERFGDRLASIDPVTGAPTVVSSNSMGGGPAYGFLDRLDVAPDGTLVVTDFVTAFNDRILLVDPSTGDRMLVDDLGSGAPTLVIQDLAVVPAGVNLTPMLVPEPSLRALLALALGGVAVARRR